MRARARERATIPRRDAAIGVARGVADVICLGLDDAAARHAVVECPHDHFADQKTSELGGIDWHSARSNTRGRSLSRRFHPVRSTRCAREGPGSNGSTKYWVSRAALPSRNSMKLTE